MSRLLKALEQLERKKASDESPPVSKSTGKMRRSASLQLPSSKPQTSEDQPVEEERDDAPSMAATALIEAPAIQDASGVTREQIVSETGSVEIPKPSPLSGQEAASAENVRQDSERVETMWTQAAFPQEPILEDKAAVSKSEPVSAPVIQPEPLEDSEPIISSELAVETEELSTPEPIPPKPEPLAPSLVVPEIESPPPAKADIAPSPDSPEMVGPEVIQHPLPSATEQLLVEPNSQLDPSNSFLRKLQSNLTHPLLGEQYRNLARNISADCDAQKSSAIAFTATRYDPSVSEMTAQVALLLAEEQIGKVLLIDGDCTQRFLSRQLQINDRLGLANLLSGVPSWRDLIIGSSVEGLSILPAGSGVVNGGESDSAVVNDLFYELRKEFRTILVTANAPSHPFSQVLVRECHGAYLIISLGETDSEKTARCVEQYQLFGGRILGCIATNAPSWQVQESA